jgi:septal ring factor EnvC (AmiA/AmiB activator)
MASDIAVKIRAVAKEREQLQAAVEKVGAKETALRRQMTTLDREKERIEGRIAEIDAALRPLESLLGVNPGPWYARRRALSAHASSRRSGGAISTSSAPRASRTRRASCSQAV